MISLISGIIVCASIIPYVIRTYQKKIEPNIVSWSIWSIIGISLLLNSIAAKTFENNPWPLVFNTINPTIIALMVLFRWNREPLYMYEKISGAIGVLSLILWFFFQNDPSLALFSLIMALVADIAAGVPTLLFVLRSPDKERPFVWFIFGIGYGLSMFTLGNNWAEYLVPGYMTLAGITISIPPIVHRIKNSIPLKEWI